MADQITRDFRQRSLGWLGVSMMAHVGVLALLAMGPRSEALQPNGTPEGTAPGAVTVELDTPATGMNEPSATTAAPDAKADEIAASAPSEVLLASNDDMNAVPLPAAKKIAAPVVAEVPKPKPAKIAKAAKAKVVKPAPEKVASDEGEVEIANALAAARVKEEVDAQPVAQADESSEPTASEPQEPTKPEADEEEIETAKAQETEATVSAATAPAEEPAKEEPAPQAAPKAAALAQQPAPQATVAQPAAAAPAPAAANQAAVATAPANAMAAPMSQQGSGGMTAQPGVAAAKPGPAAAGQSLRAGGLGYSVPMGVQIRDASELVARAGNPSPVYPQQDRLLGRQGLAVVIGKISNDGSVISVSLERSSGSPTMDQEALKTFAKWKFMPGQQGMVRKPFQFVLAGTAKEMPAKLRR